MKNRWFKELFLLPYYHLLYFISFCGILFYNYRGLSPQQFRADWKNWLDRQENSYEEIKKLPMLSPAVTLFSALVAGAIGSYIMY